MSFSVEQTAELRKKLDPSHVRPQKKFGPKGDYIEGWHAIDEANRIFGFDAWSYEVLELKCVFEGKRQIGKEKADGFGVTYVARIRVSVEGTIRDDVGAGHGYDKDCGLAHESACKEAVTDALKRCLRTYGNPFGLALYDKEKTNVGVDIDWAGERDDLTKMLSHCADIAELAELWRTPRFQRFLSEAPSEFSSPLIKIKEQRKQEPRKAA